MIRNQSELLSNHINWHDDYFFLLTMGFALVFMTVLMASSKMSFNPS